MAIARLNQNTTAIYTIKLEIINLKYFIFNNSSQKESELNEKAEYCQSFHQNMAPLKILQ